MKKKLWYIFCFLILALIDWRRGSADGVTQLTFSYMTGAAVALMMLPEVIKIWKLNLKNIIGIIVAATLGVTFFMLGSPLLEYKGERATAAISLGISLYLIFVYISCKGFKTFLISLKSPWYVLVIVLILLQTISRNDSLICLYYFICFGAFTLYFREISDKEEFFMPILYGFIIWFFIQQAFVFGFRPWDKSYYTGMYFGVTQNSMHYLMAFTACLLLSYFNKGKKFLSWFFFIVSGLLACLTLMTGRKTAVIAEFFVVIVILLYGHYKEKMWGLRAFGKGCVILGITILLFVPLYGALRYFPTILHHPIYFYNEYSDERSVRSFDSWDSTRYISFESAFDNTLGRYLRVLGLDVSLEYEDTTMDNAGTDTETITEETPKIEIPVEDLQITNNMLTVQTEYDGATYVWLNNYLTSDPAREIIYAYYFENLNLLGHTKADGTFIQVDGLDEIPEGTVFTDMHNMFLEIFYRDGIPAGVIFLGLYVWMLVRSFRRAHSDKTEFIRLGFLIAMMIMGSFENVLNVGFMCLTMIVLLFATMDISKPMRMR